MLGRMLKQDLKQRKSVNLILFVFISLATLFLASSVNNILVVTTSITYYMDYEKVPDISLITSNQTEEKKILSWLKEKAPYVKDYGNNILLPIEENQLAVVKKGKTTPFKANNINMFLGTNDTAYSVPYDEAGKEVTLQPHEIGMTRAMMERNDLSVNGQLRIKIGGEWRTFTLRTIIKDASFGNDMFGMNRILLNQKDFHAIEKSTQGAKTGLYYVNTGNAKAFKQAWNEQQFTTVMNVVDRSMYESVYSLDMVMAGLLIAIGLCMILLALLVLRFTLLFTMEEEYEQIGILKAIGCRNRAIRKLYLMKYLLLVASGSFLGLCASFPISKAMVNAVAMNMIMEDSRANFGINLLCAFLIVVLVLGFCYGCTRKMNQISAITAIRSGHSGESFQARHRLSIIQHPHLPVSVFLAWNDIRTHLKRYLLLMITFCISFILITIPLNTLNTMDSEEMASKFMLDPTSSILALQLQGKGDTPIDTLTALTKRMQVLEEELHDHGHTAQLSAVMIFFVGVKGEHEKQAVRLLATQQLNKKADYLTYSEGSEPLLANEIAVSKPVLEEQGWQIGDWIQLEVQGKSTRMMITGTYSDYMQLGQSVRLNDKLSMKEAVLFDYIGFVHMQEHKSQNEWKQLLKKELKDYRWWTSKDFVDQNIGAARTSLKALVLPMSALLCALIMLITLLMEKLFIIREKGEIAMLKSIGFSLRSIRIWQSVRIVIVALISMLAAIPLSFLSNHFILKPIFAIMGADIHIQVEPLQVYGLCPLILFTAIFLTVWVASGAVKRIHIQEINHQE